MQPQTITALQKLTAQVSDPWKGELHVTDSHIWIESELGRIDAFKRDDGRWLIARWNDQQQQYQSGDLTQNFRKYNQYCSFCFARTLEGLGGIRSYRSPVEALRAHCEREHRAIHGY